MATIYLLSGLGADASVFQNLDFGEHITRFIEWMEPTTGESMSEYAFRLAEQIEPNQPILIGVSFGGMIAVEIAKTIDCQKVILISSAKTKNDIPRLYKICGRWNLHRLIPITFLKRANILTYWFFGMETNHDRSMLKEILRKTDSIFLKWAMNAIVHWQNEESDHRLVHIHGDSDRILPVSNIRQVDFIIPDGGHLMIYNLSDPINKILRSELR